MNLTLRFIVISKYMFLKVLIGFQQTGNSPQEPMILSVPKLLPDVKIIWSEILPRSKWCNSENKKAMNEGRKRLSNSMGAFVVSLGGHYLRYNDISLIGCFIKTDGIYFDRYGERRFPKYLLRGSRIVSLLRNSCISATKLYQLVKG